MKDDVTLCFTWDLAGAYDGQPEQSGQELMTMTQPEHLLTFVPTQDVVDETPYPVGIEEEHIRCYYYEDDDEGLFITSALALE